MSLEDVCTIEALLRRTARTRAETAHHRALIMRQSVSILVVLASEAFGVVFAGWDGALLRSFILVSEHVRLQVFEVSAACRIWAETFAGLIGR